MSERIPPAVRARLVVKGLTPPYLWSLLKGTKHRLRGGFAEPAPDAPPAPEPESESEQAGQPEWEHVPEGFAHPARGWDAEGVAHAYREKWPSFLAAVEGPGPLGVNHEVPAGVPVPRDEPDHQQVILAFGYVLALAAAARGDGSVSMLDWGGGPGHYGVLAPALLPGIEVEYHSKDVPLLAALGRELAAGGTYHDDDGCLARRYDLVLASGSIHYSEDWAGTLGGLAGAAERYLYVTRVPVAFEHDSFAVIQRPYAYGYETEYVGWVVNRDRLVQEGRAAGMELVREVLLPGSISVEAAPESPVAYRGFVFARR